MCKKLLALLLTVAFAVTVAGCGGSNQATQQSKQEKKTITIAYTPWTGYGALFVAKEKGFFKEKGVDVELQSIEGVGDRKQALVADKVQAMAASLDVATSAAGEGVPMKFVWAFDASNGADGLIVKNGKGINTVADLKGKEIAFHNGSASHFFLSTVLKKAGLTDSDIKPVDMKASEAASAFMAGKVDAAVTWEPHLSKAVAAGDKVLTSTKDTPGLIADIIAFRDEFVKSNPEQVQAVVAALAEASDYIQQHPDESNKIIADALKMKPEDIADDMKTVKIYTLNDNLSFYGTKEQPGPIFAVGKAAGEFYVDIKVLPKVPDLSGYIDNEFVLKLKK